MKRNTIFESCLALLVLLFASSAVSKLLHWKEFNFDMHNQPFPKWLQTVLILFLPPVELLIVAMILLVKKAHRLALQGSLILVSAFSLYGIAILLGFFPRRPCSCGGILKGLSWEWHVMLTTAYIIISAIALSVQHPKQTQKISYT